MFEMLIFVVNRVFVEVFSGIVFSQYYDCMPHNELTLGKNHYAILWARRCGAINILAHLGYYHKNNPEKSVILEFRRISSRRIALLSTLPMWWHWASVLIANASSTKIFAILFEEQ